MSTVVQATCPGCQRVLRIPAEWLGQAFKCKHCGMVIQARGKAPAAAAPPAKPVAKPAAVPVAKPVAAPPTPPRPARPAKPSSADPFAFDDADAPASSPRSRPRRRSRGGPLLGLLLAGAGLAVAAGAALVAWPYLSRMLTNPGGVAVLIEDTGKGEGDPGPTEESRPRDAGKKSDLIVRRETGKSPGSSTQRGAGKTDLPVPAGAFPRRALAVSVNGYLFANPINYGLPGGGNVQALLDRFTQPNALRLPANQVGLLSDAAADRLARPPTGPVIRGTIETFLNDSRAQDRLLLLVVGHVVEIDGEPVLLPIDGDVQSRDGTVPLPWIYERLAACKARQKVLILDTCRLDPSKGQERPGSGPMGAKLDALLQAPPPGVQVWSACVAEQYSFEFEGGDVNNGLFLKALYDAVANVAAGKIQGPTDSFPLERLVEAVNARMKEELVPLGKVQTSRLTGRENEDGAAPDPNEPPPPKPKVVAPPPRPGGTADLTLVRGILREISFPPLKVAKDQKPLTAEALPPFPAETLKDYMKEGEATPLRDEVQKARGLLDDIAAKHKLNDGYRAIAEAPLKAQVQRDQKQVAQVILELQDEYDALKAVAEHRKAETKRWQATYDYIVARMEAQLAYLNEYQAVLGQILKGLAAPDPKLYGGWRLASQYDPQTGDSAAKKMATESRKKLDKIIQTYPQTPWAVMARRDKASALGLEWQPTK